MPRQAPSGKRTPLHTSLPAGPLDGQEINYLADAANGIVWRFRYRSASASAYKWEFIGGSALRVENVGGSAWGVWESATSVTFAVLPTPGPTITAPLAGDYDVSGSAMAYGNTVDVGALMLWKTGDGAPSWNPYDAVEYVGAARAVTIAVRKKRTGVAAGDVFELRYGVSGGNTYFNARSLYVQPVRVG